MKAQLLQWKRVTSSQRDEPTHKKPLKPVCLAIVRLRPPESTALALIEGAFKMPSFFLVVAYPDPLVYVHIKLRRRRSSSSSSSNSSSRSSSSSSSSSKKKCHVATAYLRGGWGKIRFLWEKISKPMVNHQIPMREDSKMNGKPWDSYEKRWENLW